MKKVLIVIHDMRIGGAQKSLLSFLQCLAESPAKRKYDVSLMVIDPSGPFMAQIPETVTLVPPPKSLRWLGSALSIKLIREHFSWKSLMGEGKWLLQKTFKRFPKGLNLQQKLWNCWESYIPALQQTYDVAVSYMDGVPNYYVVDKVQALKKVLWVHSEYQKQKYDQRYDRLFYEAAKEIITISQQCKSCLIKEFPHLEEKIHVLENITSSHAVLEKSQQGDSPEFQGVQGLKLLTVARLNPQKGIDLAAEAASLLKKRNLDFLWLVAGDGPEHEKLQEKINQLGICDCFQLLGSRENPYTYMRTCDVLVQPSRVEGRSIVLDEAKVLCKPIVATNYTTVVDSLEQEKTGLVVDMTPQGIADGIMRLAEDPALRNKLTENLQALPKGNEEEFAGYMHIMM